MLNKAILIGNVGQKPEIRTTKNGEKMASFSIATNKKYKKQDGTQEKQTEWHKIVSFATSLNENVIEPYVNKGDKLYIEGELQTRKWEKDGTTRHTTEIVLNKFAGVIVMLGSNENPQGLPDNLHDDEPQDNDIPY
jgi:single-strand DNA-binding protein|tara:strand:- start:3434 stop:3841 length:408 start_codon:yes stop_codon:yes gene_type:complete